MKKSLIAMAVTLFAQTAFSGELKETWRGQSITEFSNAENSNFGWRVIDDGVMGGLSKGNHKITDAGILKFWGDLSTKNNGGFSLLASEKVDMNLSNDLGLLLKVRGDGRTYTARLVTDARYRGMEVSFSADFETQDGSWTQVKIPWSDFKGSFRGMDLPREKFDPSQVQRIGLLIGDKKDAPFNLEIDYIQTYGKGQGDFKENASGVTKKEKTGPQPLIATAVADGRFTILKQALDAAKLTPFFQWDNPLTVFAPTDEAFKKLPDGVLEDLLKPENKDKLVAILSYHVVTGSTELGVALKAKSAKTIQGEPIKFEFANGKVQVNDAKLINSDVECSDGLIHVIDSVLLPPSMKPVASN